MTRTPEEGEPGLSMKSSRRVFATHQNAMLFTMSMWVGFSVMSWRVRAPTSMSPPTFSGA
jgi:hypothetical protein